MNQRFSVEPGMSYQCDVYREVYQEVMQRLRTMSPTGKTFIELKRFAQSKAREITDSSETLQDDMRICHQAIIDSARAYLLQDHQD
jgi:hypothetical protein